jgi:hypothetical protein
VLYLLLVYVSSRGSLLPFLFLFWIVDTLTAANARIAALEAKLTASREAWEGANAAKVAAEKATKSAGTKAKKAKKALVDADQKRVRREQAIAELKEHVLPYVVLVINDNPYGLMFALSYICRTCP